MPKTVHLIHGFNENHPLQAPKITRLVPSLTDLGYRVRIHDYGHWDLVAVRNNANLARLIYPSVKPGDTLVGFSNGAALVARLVALGVQPGRIVLIQPALGNKWEPPADCKVEKVTVFWNPKDNITTVGKWWGRVTDLMPWRWKNPHGWGEMGDTGYLGSSPLFEQFNTLEPEKVASRYQQIPNPASGHSGWQKPESSGWWKLIADCG